MDDVVGAVWSAQRGSEAVGKVIQGLAVLCARYEQLWLIVEGRQPDPVRSKDIGFSLGGITIGGRLLVPFANVKPWERDSGEPCVCFEMVGAEAIFAPATPPADGDFSKDIERFLRQNWYDTDTVYLSDLDGSVGTREGDDLKVRRPAHQAEAADTETLSADDEIVALGEVMCIGDITWFESEIDGDGNRHAHFVMGDGRYRRLSLGDLGR